MVYEGGDEDLLQPHADADHDDWPNLAEFLMGSDGASAASAPELELRWVGGRAEVSWTERADRRDIVEATLLLSADLELWSGIGISGVPEAPGLLRFRYLLPASSGERGFARLSFRMK